MKKSLHKKVVAKAILVGGLSATFGALAAPYLTGDPITPTSDFANFAKSSLGRVVEGGALLAGTSGAYLYTKSRNFRQLKRRTVNFG